MGERLGFDLVGRDVLAPPPDRVLDAVGEVAIVLLVPAEAVAGVEPAVAPRLCGGLGIGVVAVVWRLGAVGAHDRLADDACGNLAVVLVHDAAFHACTRPPGAVDRCRSISESRGQDTSVMLKSV
jgi:hypothetical protein